jgi:hypothetical protein
VFDDIETAVTVLVTPFTETVKAEVAGAVALKVSP